MNLSDGGGEGCDSPADDRTDSPNTNDSRSAVAYLNRASKEC